MKLDHLDVEAERLRLELRLTQLEAQEKATSNFLPFCQYVWPEMLVSIIGGYARPLIV